MEARPARRASFSMTHRLPEHISFGLIGQRAVVLDFVADRYLLLGERETAALGALGRANEDPCPTVLAALVSRGLIVRGDGAIAPVTAEEPRSSALEAIDREGHVAFWEAGLFRIGAGCGLRWRGLAETIRAWRDLRTRYSPVLRASATDEEAAHVARGYALARTYVPAPHLCVPDSLALARVLWRRGIAANVFFGVRLAPFSAHSWVQRGGLLLSDRLGRVTDHVAVFRL